MGKIRTLIFLSLSTCAIGYADTVTWGPAILSANSAGPFLSGFTFTIAGTKWILDLPSFSQSSFASAPGEVDLLLSADYAGGISGLTFQYFGTIDQTEGPATVSYVQTASDSPGAAGDFSTTPFSGSLDRPVSTHIELETTLTLKDNGGSVAINQIEFDLATVPEPSSLISALLLTSGLGLALRLRRRKK